MRADRRRDWDRQPAAHNKHSELHTTDRLSRGRLRPETLRDGVQAGGAGQPLRSSGNVPARVRRSHQSTLPETAEDQAAQRSGDRRMVGTDTAAHRGGGAQVAGRASVGVAREHSLQHRIHKGRAGASGGCLHAEVQGRIRHLPQIGRLMVHRRAHTCIYARQIRHRSVVQLQGPDRHRRLHPVGRILEPGLLSQPSQRLHACPDRGGTDTGARLQNAWQRPDIPV